MALLVHEVLEKARKQKTKAEKIKVLKENETWALKDILRGTFDDSVQWNLPNGEPPYTPNKEESAPANLLREHKKFGYFVKGGPGDKLPSVKRERIFFEIIEGIHPEDARLVVNMICKKSPQGITKAIVKDAFPGLIQQ